MEAATAETTGLKKVLSDLSRKVPVLRRPPSGQTIEDREKSFASVSDDERSAARLHALMPYSNIHPDFVYGGVKADAFEVSMSGHVSNGNSKNTRKVARSIKVSGNKQRNQSEKGVNAHKEKPHVQIGPFSGPSSDQLLPSPQGTHQKNQSPRSTSDKTVSFHDVPTSASSPIIKLVPEVANKSSNRSILTQDSVRAVSGVTEVCQLTPEKLPVASKNRTPRQSNLGDSSVIVSTTVLDLTPPVARPDRRRSGMPDAFAIQLDEELNQSAADIFPTAQSEPIRGDPTFEPYRDMLREGATEAEVTKAMVFFGIDPNEFFGRNVLAEHLISSPTNQFLDRDESSSLIQRKLQLDEEKLEKRGVGELSTKKINAEKASTASEVPMIVTTSQPRQQLEQPASSESNDDNKKGDLCNGKIDASKITTRLPSPKKNESINNTDKDLKEAPPKDKTPLEVPLPLTPPQTRSEPVREDTVNPPPIPPTRSPRQPMATLLSTDSSVAKDIQGTLLKKTKGGQWHLRSFFLRDKQLCWLKSDQKTLLTIMLTPDSQVREVTVGLKKFMFEVSVPNHHPLVVAAAGEAEKYEWIRAIQFAISGKLPLSTRSMKKTGSLALLNKGQVSAVKSVNAEKIMLGLTKNAGVGALTSTMLKSQTANDRLNEKLSALSPAKPSVTCAACNEVVYKMEEVTLQKDRILHRKCFVCNHCKRHLNLSNFALHNNQIFCQVHYTELFIANEPSTIASSSTATASAGPPQMSPTTKAQRTESPRVVNVKLGLQLEAQSLTKQNSLASMIRPARDSSSQHTSPLGIDNSAALSRPVVPKGKRRKPSMHPNADITRQVIGSISETQDRMTSERTFKVLVNPSNTAGVVWMHASSRIERDHWVNCLCNIIQALEMRRQLEEAQKVSMLDAVQCQADLEDFLSKNETSYSGYCEKLSIRSHRNWRRRWFELTEIGELKYSGDESKKPKNILQLSHRSVILDAHDNRLSGPLAID